MAAQFTVHRFFQMFPDDDACLDYLMKVRFGEDLDCPKCEKRSRFARLRRMPAYACPWCGHHIHPMVGTPFERTRTSLQSWFYAMYLFSTSRHGVPAKELQRQLGVSYKTAWRMGHEIRKHMAIIDGDDSLSGTIEADETYIGGRRRGGKRGRGAPRKTVVFGIVERAGKVLTRVVPNVRRKTLEALIVEKARAGSTLSTDELASYARLGEKGFVHGAIHRGRGEYASGTWHVNTLECFWSQLKRAIRGTHVHVSTKHLPKYLGEFEYRFNLRKAPALMCACLIASF
jgi:transposase